MINGAQQIIGNVPGRFLNPLLIAESQAADHSGFIVVMYNLEPRQYDMLFLQGRAITHCARMNKDLRFFIDQHAVVSTFREHHRESFVSLFTCDDASMQRFIATFHSEPCLKVHVDALSKPQILALIRSTGCSQGIIERNDFAALLPVIELNELTSPKKLPVFAAGYAHGRLLVYDLVKNQEVQSHRFSPVVLQPSVYKKRARKPRISQSRAVVEEAQSIDSVPKDTAEAVEALVHEILAGSQLTNDDCPLIIDNSLPTTQISDQTDQIEAGPTPPFHFSESPSVAESWKAGKSRSSGTAITDQPSTNNFQQNTDQQHAPPEPSPPETPPEFQPSIQEALPTEETKQTKQTEPTVFTRTLERLLRLFRQQVVDLCAQRAESLFASAEKKVRMLTPEFDPRMLGDEQAILVLDLIEKMVRQAPLLKRSKLRETAAELVSDLYNKQYELLEDHSAVDAVEQCYYRLKGSKS